MQRAPNKLAGSILMCKLCCTGPGLLLIRWAFFAFCYTKQPESGETNDMLLIRSCETVNIDPFPYLEESFSFRNVYIIFSCKTKRVNVKVKGKHSRMFTLHLLLGKLLHFTLYCNSWNGTVKPIELVYIKIEYIKHLLYFTMNSC